MHAVGGDAGNEGSLALQSFGQTQSFVSGECDGERYEDGQ